MRIAVMQPYFLPYIGYFSLIKHTDKFVILDEVQYMKGGWIAHNRILKSDSGWNYFTVPIKKHKLETMIKDVLINNNESWKQKLLAQLQRYKKAPFYKEVISVLDVILAEEYNDISSLNIVALQEVCRYLNVENKFPVQSQINLQLEAVNASDEWPLQICKALSVNEYLNPIGGLSFYDRSKYENAGIDIKFQKVNLQEYNQKMPSFEPGLSIIDVMMFNSIEKINEMLDDYVLL